jgi:F-type H+-transporting ATPase subunit b
MLIDWFTVGAQVLNFIILVWLLKRFLYRPVLNAIDAREKRIADERADADAKKADALQERDDFQRKNREFDEARAALLKKATDEAGAERERLLGEARKEAEGLRASQVASLQGDRRRLEDAIALLASREVFGIARKALADLASVSLEKSMAEVFLRRLGEMDAASREALGAALRANSEPAVVRSPFALDEAQRASIQNSLNVAFSAEVRLTFETAPYPVCGIELTAQGRKLGWSIDSYLKELEQRVGGLLEARDAPATAAAVHAPVA